MLQKYRLDNGLSLWQYAHFTLYMGFDTFEAIYRLPLKDRNYFMLNEAKYNKFIEVYRYILEHNDGSVPFRSVKVSIKRATVKAPTKVKEIELLTGVDEDYAIKEAFAFLLAGDLLYKRCNLNNYCKIVDNVIKEYKKVVSCI